MDENTLARLREIRKNIEERAKENKDSLPFPKGYCAWVSTSIANELGFQIVHGEFCVEGHTYNHSWNLGPSGEIIDLTASQFDSTLPPVYVASIDDRYSPYVVKGRR